MDILQYQHYYLVGIKGVAMTALAQCLADAGKHVRGCDVAEHFVTQSNLDQLGVIIDTGFTDQLPDDIDCVIYTAAHQGFMNLKVAQAQESGVAVVSYAEAVASLFNQKKGVAVCGVGGKSTVTAMIVWILEELNRNGKAEQPSYVLGVGGVPGLPRTGNWQADSEHFVIEADEYVADPTAPQRGDSLTPKLLYLQPEIVVCTNLKFDHPDVFTDFEHTKRVFHQFFTQIHHGGTLIVNKDDGPLLDLARDVLLERTDLHLRTFAQSEADFWFSDYESKQGKTTATVQNQDQSAPLTLALPGQFNVKNALAALAAVQSMQVPLSDATDALTTFRSTKRRFEYIGTKNGVWYYDDYAHHPHEVAATIQALNEWFPNNRKIVIFQPHTFSRTKQLFSEFIQAFSQAQEVILTDIFASAREKADDSISSDSLVEALRAASPASKVRNVHTNEEAAAFLKSSARPGDVVLTMGAGDVYHLHEHLSDRPL